MNKNSVYWVKLELKFSILGKSERKFKMKTKENKSLFLEQFGDTPQLRVLDFLIDNHMFDFPMTEIARGSNVSYNSIVLFFEDWVKREILVKTRKIGKSNYYKLNIDNPFIKDLIRLDWVLTKNSILSNKKETQLPIHR